ncbi:hypothetical protein [Desmospora activa]|uniref:hypothetical protein n=1 Tax=Desmospora activa TaxID=500615 RepID=UPI000D2FA73C|nr:hypothetical protein [Desmospora activa]
MIVDGILAFFMTGGLIGYLGLEGRASRRVRRVFLSISLAGVILGILWSPRFLYYVLVTTLCGGIITYSRIVGYKEESDTEEIRRRKMM